jgi:hypothetical protein
MTLERRRSSCSSHLYGLQLLSISDVLLEEEKEDIATSENNGITTIPAKILSFDLSDEDDNYYDYSEDDISLHDLNQDDVSVREIKISLTGANMNTPSKDKLIGNFTHSVKGPQEPSTHKKQKSLFTNTIPSKDKLVENFIQPAKGPQGLLIQKKQNTKIILSLFTNKLCSHTKRLHKPRNKKKNQEKLRGLGTYNYEYRILDAM